MKLLFRHLVHAPRRARSSDLQMMKGDSRLNHRLQEKFLRLSDFPHPTIFPGIMRRMKLALVEKVYARDVLDRIGNNMRLRVRRALRFIIHARAHLFRPEFVIGIKQ